LIFKKNGGILTFKSIRIKYVLLSLIVFTASILLIFNKVSNRISTSRSSSSNGEWIVVTVTKSDSKSELWMIDTKDQRKQKLVSDRYPMIAGKVNAAGDILIYSDAIGNNPWDIFKLNIPANETYQITDDPLGQFNLHFGGEKENIVLAKSGGKISPVPQISIVDINGKNGRTIELDPDIAVQDFDVRDNKIIALTFSFEEFIKKKFKENDNSAKISYSIIEMDMDGSNKKVVSEIKAVSVDSISFSKSKDFIILGGAGIHDNEQGFYKLDINKNKIENLLTEEQVKKTNEVSQISQPFIAALSSDEKNIYFAAIPTGTSEKNIMGITVYPNALYCYNFDKMEISKVFEIPDGFIPSISFTYK
jgi:Tol biopolymer transport system component